MIPATKTSTNAAHTVDITFPASGSPNRNVACDIAGDYSQKNYTTNSWPLFHLTHRDHMLWISGNYATDGRGFLFASEKERPELEHAVKATLPRLPDCRIHRRMFADLDRSGSPRDAACLTRRLSRLAVQIPRNAVLAVLVDVVVIDWISSPRGSPPIDGRGRRSIPTTSGRSRCCRSG